MHVDLQKINAFISLNLFEWTFIFIGEFALLLIVYYTGEILYHRILLRNCLRIKSNCYIREPERKKNR